MEADCQRHYQMDLGEAVFGAHPQPLRRLFALIRYLPADGALYAVTHPDEQSSATYFAPAPPTRTVTSLRGVNLAQLYASAEGVND